jgi:hypothetical protein
VSSEGEHPFLTRWALRKQAAKQEARAPDAEVEPVPTPEGTRETTMPDTTAAAQAEPEPFDLSSLPTLDSLTEATDIRVFMQAGVPEELRNAALRQLWTLDRGIRDYVSPALDYAYDWNAAGGVPGNGALSAATDVARMVAEVFSGAESQPDPAGANEGVAPHELNSEKIQLLQNIDENISQVTLNEGSPDPAFPDAVRQSSTVPQTDTDVPILSHNERPEGAASEGSPDQSGLHKTVRRHGGAMPQ